jgi:hypothetical protein
MPLLSFFSLLPVILIVACSILLDYALRHETIGIRCQCQVWMWMAVAMSWMQESKSLLDPDTDDFVAWNNGDIVFYSWAHATLFLNVLSIVTEATNTSQGPTSRRYLSILSPARAQYSAQILRMLSVSSWSSMLYSACKVSGVSRGKWPQCAYSSIQLFFAMSLVLCLASWHFKRQEKLETWIYTPRMKTTVLADGATDMGPNRFCHPLSFSSSNNDGMNESVSPEIGRVDESHWYLWNRRQTLGWLSQQLMEKECTLSTLVPQSMDDLKAEHDVIVSKLAVHLVSGDVLEELADVSILILLQIPFGPACRLSKSIGRLVNRYPNPETERSFGGPSVGVMNTMESCLSQHDQEYNSSRFTDTMESFSAVTPPKIHMMAALDVPHATETHSSKDVDRRSDVTNESCGLEMPKVHSDNVKIPESSIGHDPMQQPRHRIPSEPVTSDHSSTSISDAAIQIPQRFLDQMPPFIQEIAKRRPELVNQLLAQKQRELRQPAPQKAASDSVGDHPQQGSPTSGVPNEMLGVRRAEEADPDDIDDETMSLLQHDANCEDPVRYRSIDISDGLR